MGKFPTPSAGDMFSDATTPLEITNRYEEFQTSITKSLGEPRHPWGGGGATLAKQLDEHKNSLNKSVNPQSVEAVRNALAQMDMGKDWTTTNPLASGLVAYDLAAPALLLAPRPTPLRNRIARTQGQGLNHQFKRVLGFSGSRTGGAAGAPINPGIDETTTNTFGPGNISYARGPKIQYSADEKIIPYVQCGLSDEVSWAAQFSGRSFQDTQQLSTQSLLYASMLSEESLLLGGRGTKSGYAGALAAPTGLTLTKRTAASNEVGATGSITNLYVRVTSVGVWGESVSSAEATVASVASGQVVDITLTDAVGALGYHVFVGTTTGAANCFAAAVSNSSASRNVAPLAAGSAVPGAPITVHFTGGGTGGAPNAGSTAPTADSSAFSNNYDGLLTYVTGAQSGYTKRLNAPLSAAGSVYANNPGGEFETAFASLWDSVKADPDEIFAAGRDRMALSDLLKTQSSSSYRIQIDNSSEVHNAKIGAVVTGLQNEVTGKMVDVTVHPWVPQGTMPIVSWTLPMPDSNVGNCWEVRTPQDFMQINWPVSQYLYESSTYWFSSLIAYAPMWSGCIQGIFQA